MVAPGRLSFSGPAGPVLAYGPLQATDASGRVVPTQLSLADGDVQIVVYDARATYPLDIDSRITASRAPVASFSGTSSASFGESVALSADGQEALVGAPAAGTGGAAYLYRQSAGSWQTTPIASFLGTSRDEGLGSSVALSGDGRVALVGTQFARSGDGSAYLYSERAGSWPSAPTASLIGSSGAGLGFSVALSGDGRVALVGAPFASGVNGAAYLYAGSASSWPTVPAAIFTGSLGQSLGSAVALSADGQVALVGGPGALLGGGTANVYRKSAGRWHTSPMVAFRGGSGEGLGSSVALSADGQEALVGADTASSGGAAFVYTSPG